MRTVDTIETMQRFRSSRPISWLLLVLAVAATGCQSNAPDALDSAISLYRGGEYEQSLLDARVAMRSGSAGTRARAQYVGGLAALKCGDISTARRELTRAANAKDESVAADANLSLATLLLDEDEPAAAARALDAASKTLTGSDRTEAIYQAGLAWRVAGDARKARTRLDTVAQSSTSDRADSARVMHAATGFAIQAGFFSDSANANRCAQRLAEAARGSGLGTVRVIRVKRSGKAFNVVQIGSFATRTDAEHARRRLGFSPSVVERVAVATSA